MEIKVGNDTIGVHIVGEKKNLDIFVDRKLYEEVKMCGLTIEELKVLQIAIKDALKALEPKEPK